MCRVRDLSFYGDDFAAFTAAQWDNRKSSGGKCLSEWVKEAEKSCRTVAREGRSSGSRGMSQGGNRTENGSKRGKSEKKRLIPSVLAPAARTAARVGMGCRTGEIRRATSAARARMVNFTREITFKICFIFEFPFPWLEFRAEYSHFDFSFQAEILDVAFCALLDFSTESQRHKG